MFFSIIVPVYNIEKYLRACLESIKSQTFSDFEVIMIDDGSTDDSPNICDEYAVNDSRFTVTHKMNGGVVSARKTAARLASGDYVVTVDGDDYIEKNLLENLYREISTYNPEYVAYGYREVDEAGQVNFERFNDINEGYYTKQELDKLREGFMYDRNKPGINGGNLIFSLWTKAIERSIYVESQMKVDDKVEKGDDLVVNIYALSRANSVLVSKISGYYYRQQPGSITHRFSIDDIYKQAIFKNEIYKASEFTKNEITNQTRVCAFYTTYERLAHLVSPASTFADYFKVIKEIDKYDLFDSLKSAKIDFPSHKEKAKLFIVRHRMWKILFLYMQIQAAAKMKR